MSESSIVTIPLNEFEKLKEALKKQQEAIDAWDKAGNTVVIDWRNFYSSMIFGIECQVPRVVADEKTGKEYLKEEFDKLYKDLIMERERSKELQWKIHELESKKNKWFNFS